MAQAGDDHFDALPFPFGFEFTFLRLGAHAGFLSLSLAVPKRPLANIEFRRRVGAGPSGWTPKWRIGRCDQIPCKCRLGALPSRCTYANMRRGHGHDDGGAPIPERIGAHRNTSLRGTNSDRTSPIVRQPVTTSPETTSAPAGGTVRLMLGSAEDVAKIGPAVENLTQEMRALRQAFTDESRSVREALGAETRALRQDLSGVQGRLTMIGFGFVSAVIAAAVAIVLAVT